MTAGQGVTFFETQFQRQVAEQDFAFNPFEKATLQFVGGIEEHEGRVFLFTNVITRDPETGIHNHGTYRAGLKAPERMVVRYLENGLISEKLRRKGLKPETKFRPDEERQA